MKKPAFTLIEVVLYITIVTLILISVSRIGLGVVNSGAKSRSQQEVASTARFLSEKIKSEIRMASGIATVSANTLTLSNFAPDTNTVINLEAGKVRINKNGSGAVNLNSNDTLVTELSFANNSSLDNLTKNISFIVTVTTATTSASQIYQANTTVRSSAEIRSN